MTSVTNHKRGFFKGMIPWNKDKVGVMPVPKNKGTHETNSGSFKKGHKQTFFSHTQATKEKIRKSSLGKIISINQRTKISKSLTGRRLTKEERIVRSKNSKKGSNHPNWKGGLTEINNKIRNSFEYRLWQDSVLSRDGGVCKKCGESNIKKLTQHHILNFASHTELRFAIDNGITFCVRCHFWFHHKYGRKNNKREQLQEFLLPKQCQ